MKPWSVPTPDTIEKWKNQGEIRKLVKLLAEPDAPHQDLAMAALKDLGSAAEGSLVAILGVSGARNELLRMAIELLALMRSRTAIDHIHKQLLDMRAEVEPSAERDRLWRACVDALGRISEDRSLDLLTELALDGGLSDVRRRRAVEAFSLADPLQVGEALTRIYWEGGFDTLRKSAVSGLIAQGSRCRGLIEKLYNESKPQGRKLILAAIGDLQGRDFLPFVVDLLDKSNDSDELDSVISALGEIGDPKAYAPLKLRFESFSPRLRLAVARALMRLGWTPTHEENDENRLYYYAVTDQFEKLCGSGEQAAVLCRLAVSSNPDALLRFVRRDISANAFHQVIELLLNFTDSPVTDVLKTISTMPGLAPELTSEQKWLQTKLNG